jgi:hypothetical protein
VRDLLLATATVRAAVDFLDQDDARRELALRLAEDACLAAATRCRGYGLDETLLRCAVVCQRAADEVQLLLTSLGHPAPD